MYQYYQSLLANYPVRLKQVETWPWASGSPVLGMLEFIKLVGRCSSSTWMDLEIAPWGFRSLVKRPIRILLAAGW